MLFKPRANRAARAQHRLGKLLRQGPRADRGAIFHRRSGPFGQRQFVLFAVGQRLRLHGIAVLAEIPLSPATKLPSWYSANPSAGPPRRS